mmetsp:Transcript_176186/g.564869  ORF Transcript_176186/g.564869 Transcript_176186/m.564869 type:complete len:219 (-) Transcript_176186:43-699(-)
MASLPRLADELVEVRALRPVAEARLAFSFGLVGRARHMQGVVVSPQSVTWLPCGSIRSSRTEHSFKSIEQSRGSSVRAGGFRGWLGVTKVHRDQDMDQTPADQLGGTPSWACRHGWRSQPKLPIPSPSTRAAHVGSSRSDGPFPNLGLFLMLFCIGPAGLKLEGKAQWTCRRADRPSARCVKAPSLNPPYSRQANAEVIKDSVCEVSHQFARCACGMR